MTSTVPESEKRVGIKKSVSTKRVNTTTTKKE